MEADKMFRLADELSELRAQRDELEQELKTVKSEMEETQYRLSEIMAETETQNFTRAGIMFYLATNTQASAMPGSKDELYAALRARGYGDLVQETVNARSLSAFVKEQREENEDTLPDWLRDCVTVYDKITVKLRKAAN